MPEPKYFISRLNKALFESRGPRFKSIGRQLLEMVDLTLRGHVDPSEYYAYGFHLSDVGSDSMAHYLPARVHWREVLPRLNPPSWYGIVHNKWLFHCHFGSAHLKLARPVGVFHPRYGFRFDCQPLRTFDDLIESANHVGLEGIVMKPVAGSAGHGIVVLSQFSASQMISIDGKHIDRRELEAILNAAPDEGFLVEECLRNHRFFREINPYTASSIRIGTLRDRLGKTVIAFALIRFGRAGSTVDNTAQGGIYASVDPATGIMGQGTFRQNGSWVWEANHPDSGMCFGGRQIPHWQDILDLAVLAAEHSGGLNSVGWDVILTPEGPALLEGNHDWDPIGQVASAGYLHAPVDSALASWELAMSGRSLPRRSFRRACQGVHWIMRRMFASR